MKLPSIVVNAIYDKNEVLVLPSFKNKHIIVMMIIIATLFLGVGYAQISDIDLSVSGSASANKQEGVVISEITYLSNNNADVAHCKINTYYQTYSDYMGNNQFYILYKDEYEYNYN